MRFPLLILVAAVLLVAVDGSLLIVMGGLALGNDSVIMHPRPDLSNAWLLGGLVDDPFRNVSCAIGAADLFSATRRRW